PPTNSPHLLTSLLSQTISTLIPNGEQSTHFHQTTYRSITINSKSKFRLNQNRRSYTNYNKANWTQFTEEIERTLANCASPKNVHSANKTLTYIILNADKHNIPKGKIKAHHLLLPNKYQRQNKCQK